MAYFNLSAFTCSGIMVMMVSLFFSVESKENYNETELNLPKVLNTSLPLYLYYTCSNIFVQNECTKNICIVETYTCINMRKNMLTNYTYNFTLSTRKNVSM
uniref:Putative lipocalin n=1 Tax=Rhipicephalus microplus TaxID=6941 RepID=A0A6G5A4U3_RHIMP